MKSISTINPAITENTDGTTVKACTPVRYKSGCVMLTQHIVSLSGLQTFGYHSKQRITLQGPLLTLHLPTSKSHTEAITRVQQIVTYEVREKGMEYKGEQR